MMRSSFDREGECSRSGLREVSRAGADSIAWSISLHALGFK